MAYLEILKDGLTVGSSVRVAGDLVRVPDDFNVLSKSAQVERWGAPRYKEISEKEFEERGGKAADAAVPFAPPPEVPPGPSPQPSAQAEKSVDEFGDFDGLNVDATLSRVAQFDDEKVARFIAWEKSGKARKTVLGPLGAL